MLTIIVTTAAKIYQKHRGLETESCVNSAAKNY